MAINSTINASINKAAFDIFYCENTPLPIELLLSREFSIKPHAYMYARNIKQLVNKVKSAMYNALQAQKQF